MTKKLSNVTNSDLDDRSAWIIQQIIKDETLQEIWKQNQIALESDFELDLTPLQRESYLIAKTILMDCFHIWAEMDPDDRKVSIESKNSIYTKLDKYMKIVHDIEQHARSRQIKRIEANQAVDNPFKDAKSVEIGFGDGSKTKIERKSSDDDEV